MNYADIGSHKAKKSWFFLRKTHLFITFATQNKEGRSPVGLERRSHIAEVIGSSPIVPTSFQQPGNIARKFPQGATKHLTAQSAGPPPAYHVDTQELQVCHFVSRACKAHNLFHLHMDNKPSKQKKGDKI